ncbi:MAG: hypothetical protein AABZ74_07915 [Cyanobacteriota bacterium]
MEKLENKTTASLYLNNSSESISCSITIVLEMIVLTSEKEQYMIPIKEAEYSLVGENNIYLVVKTEQLSICVKFQEIYEEILKNTESLIVKDIINNLKSQINFSLVENKTSPVLLIVLTIFSYGYLIVSYVVMPIFLLVAFYYNKEIIEWISKIIFGT